MKHNPSPLTTRGRISRSCEKTQGRLTMILVLILGFNGGNQVNKDLFHWFAVVIYRFLIVIFMRVCIHRTAWADKKANNYILFSILGNCFFCHHTIIVHKQLSTKNRQTGKHLVVNGSAIIWH